ncbi:MAG TPA: hypothetical protein VGJ73_20885 [Verrucomicrobiae bacterium]|jgi:hypothetical protein
MIIVVLLALLAVVQILIGIEIANRPPSTSKQKWFWRIASGVVAVGMGVLGLIQFVENDSQQRDMSKQLNEIQVQLTISYIALTNSDAENLELRREMKQQFDQLTEDFSANSAVAIEIRKGLLTNELDKTIAEGYELQKVHEVADISPEDIDAVRAETKQKLDIRANQAKQDKLQDELNSIQAQQDASNQVAADEEQKRQAEKALLDRERELSSPTIPIFDFTIRKLYQTLDDVAKRSGWKVWSSFPGQSPTIYASTLVSNGIVVNGMDRIGVGTNLAWSFTVSTVVIPPTLRSDKTWHHSSWGRSEKTYAVLTVQATTTNGDSSLSVTSHYQYNGRTGYVELFDNVQVKLDVPNQLNMDQGSPYDSYETNIDDALSGLIGAQDQQCKIP